jgi:amino acid transporter
MLAEVAYKMGGSPLRAIVCIDAITILSGGILTAIIAVSGLLKRLAKDKVLPSYLLTTNQRGAVYASNITFTLISIIFFLTIYDSTKADQINRIGGVFAISFLAVLLTFAVGAISLKLYRPKLARLEVAKWWHIIFSLFAIAAGLIGMNPQ